MTKKTVKPRRGRGKADAQREADGLTAERIRAIFSDPNTSERVRGKLERAITGLAEWMNPHVEETPDFLAQQFEDGAALLHDAPADILFAKKAAPFYARAVALAEKHEPKDARTVRLLLAAAYPDERAREAAAGGRWNGANDVLDPLIEIASEIDVLLIHPDILAAALPVVIREARRYVAEGEHPGTARLCREGLARMEKAAGARLARREEKDARLVRRLSAVLADPQRGEDHDRVLVTLCDLHNDLRASDTDPEIFPTMARVLISRARKTHKGLDRVAELEAIAGE